MPSRAFLRTSTLVLSLPLATFATLAAVTLITRDASAQVSDADRAAARDLFIDGVKHQELSKFAEALDRFQRAQAVFSAPTHLLHIAECQAALGRLVESAETYRTLVRTPLPAGAPNAFVQAQQQGNAELTQVEPRIPTLKVQVKPENVQNLSVQIDGQAMSTALVGVPRPTNPGEHTVTVFAPGYSKAESKVVLKEKEQKDLAITLFQTSGVAYGPATTTLPPPPPAYTAQPQQPPQYQIQTTQPPPPAPEPPRYEAPVDRHRGPSFSYLLGARGGVSVPGGNAQGGANTSLSGFMSAGGSFGLETGFRFARVVYFGLVFDHGVYGASGSRANLASTSTTTNYFGANFVWISNPDGVGFYGELGAGYRWLLTSDQGGTGTITQVDATLGGVEGSIGGGVHIRAGQYVRLVPKVTLYAGSFNSSSGTATVGGVTQTTNSTITNTDTHTFVFVGLAAFFDFHKRTEP